MIATNAVSQQSNKWYGSQNVIALQKKVIANAKDKSIRHSVAHNLSFPDN